MNDLKLIQGAYRMRDSGLQYWLFKDDTAVAFVKVYDNYCGHVVSLCDIETREGYRNQGFATMLLSLIAELYGVDQVHHDGGYTPDGFAYISSKVCNSGREYDKVAPAFSPMNFVADWDKLYTVYP